MKYLAETAQDVYNIYRNAVNSVFPKAKLPKALKKSIWTIIYIDGEKEESEQFEEVGFVMDENLRDKALITYDNDKQDERKSVKSVEELFKRLQKLKKYDVITVRVYEKRSIA
jgi:hypothetical protein